MSTEFQGAYELGKANQTVKTSVERYDEIPASGIAYRNSQGDFVFDSLDRHRDKPVEGRFTRDRYLYGVDSFIRYVKENLTGSTRIYAAPQRNYVKAVIDHCEPKRGELSWERHSANLVLENDDTLNSWLSIGKSWVPQATFVEFIEDHLSEIATPEGATLREMVNFLHVKKTVAFKSAVNLTSDSSSLEYEENVSGATRGGKTSLPNQITLVLPLFKHGKQYKVHARLRFSIADGKLSFKVVLNDVEKLLDKSYAEILAEIETGTGIKPFLGRA